MDGSSGPARRRGARAAGEVPRAGIVLQDIAFPSSHRLLKACSEDVGFRNAGLPCPAPEWTRERRAPISVTMGESLTLSLRLDGDGAVDLRGVGPGVLRFAADGVAAGGPGRVELRSARPIPRRIAKIDLALRWSLADGAPVSPGSTDTVAYVTMGRPDDDEEATSEEDGVTLKRMDRAVSWVEPLATLRPHSIVRGLMSRFPYYALHPSPKVPRKYHHPTYFNDEGGAWPMSEYPDETGECQAIVRLVRGMLRQLGVPGEARALLVWADPEVDGGRTAVAGYWDEDPSAGLDRTRMVNDKRWLATLVDQAVEEGKAYPASHTILPDGNPSPGFNRYEACLEFTHEGVTRLYGGGAGVFRSRDSVLRAFWGLVWVTEAPKDGFRVEKIVRRYRGGGQ